MGAQRRPGRQGIAGDSAVWQAVEPAQDWFIPIPAGQGRREVVVATSNNAEVQFQVDFYGPDGVEEGLIEGTLPPRGREVLDVAAITDEAVGVRVISTGPIVAILWLESEAGLAVTTAADTPSNRWFLPGAGKPVDGTGTLVILNVGIDDSTVRVRPLRPGGLVQPFSVEPDTVLELALETADGYLVESVGETVVMWSGRRGEASTAAIGVAVSDG